MQRYSQEGSFVDEMPSPNQIWQSFSDEEVFIGGNEITNTAFGAEFMANWQMPPSSHVLPSEDTEFLMPVGLAANHLQMHMVNQSSQVLLNEEFFTGIDQTPAAYQSWQRPFKEDTANQAEYPTLDQFLFPEIGHAKGGHAGSTTRQLPCYNTAITIQLPVNPSADPTTGRYPCPYPICNKDFKRSSDRRRHILSIHQRGQTTQGRNLCPIVGCRRSYGKGLCRPDKVNDHLRKIHGLVRVSPSGGSGTAGTSINGAGGASTVAGGAGGLAGNGN